MWFMISQTDLTDAWIGHDWRARLNTHFAIVVMRNFNTSPNLNHCFVYNKIFYFKNYLFNDEMVENLCLIRIRERNVTIGHGPDRTVISRHGFFFAL